MSKVLPSAIQDRPDLNLRQGIKSSLSNWKQLLASLYLFHGYGGSSFCKEVPVGAKTQLDVDDQFALWMNSNWGSVTNVVSLVKQSALYSAQMEHLQVGLELFLKLAKVSFVDANLADSAERTGGSRFAKRIRFSTNMKLLVDTINSYAESDRENFLTQWLSGVDDAVVGNRVKEVLAPFTEECQYKIRTASGEISFQEDGVYDGLRNSGDTVESSDVHEPVGPFRILKSYVKEGMHPYISDSSNGFSVKVQRAEFTNYADMVRTTLELIPKRTTVFQEVAPSANQRQIQANENVWQSITYGAPGTGKSFKIKDETKKETVYRTTFHPDSDYASFVGAYKPIMKRDGVALTEVFRKRDDKFILEEKHDQRVGIGYDFVDQVFTQAYIKAWEYQKIATSSAQPKKVFLVIEEINRGNCAQVFGDLFQLLDRKPEGFSDYAINPDSDLGEHIGAELAKVGGAFDPTRKTAINNLYPEVEDGTDVVDEVLAGRLMLLPDNLYIRATMNTSDQSLFPMDSAFKRRWDWDYVAIQNHTDEDWKIEINPTTHYRWWEFLEAINKEIFKATSSEDKQLGYYFVRTADKKIDLNMFVNKVVFYLWNSVFKDCYTEREFMKQDKDKYFTFTSFFKDGAIDAAQVKAFLGNLKGLKSVEEQDAAKKTAATNAAAQTEEPPAENA